MKAIAATLVLAAAVLSPPVLAQGASPIDVTAPWLRATPKGAPVAGGYATIKNKGATADRLVGASLAIASKGEVHAMSMKNGVMHMKRLADGLVIPPGQTVELQPGGFHLMFLKPTSQLKPGETVKGSLTFAKAGRIPVTFAVAGMAANAAPGSAVKGSARGHAMKGMSGMDMH